MKAWKPTVIQTGRIPVVSGALLAVLFAVLEGGCAAPEAEIRAPRPGLRAVSPAGAAAALGWQAPGQEAGAASGSYGGGPVSLGGGIGFTADPDSFLLAFEADFHPDRRFGIGPLIQLGVSDDDFLLAPTLNFKGIFHLEGPDWMARTKPFVQGGPGFLYLHDDDRRKKDPDDIGFLINLGGGADYYIQRNVALGTSMLFNIVPDQVLGENFFFSWQVATVKFNF